MFSRLFSKWNDGESLKKRKEEEESLKKRKEEEEEESLKNRRYEELDKQVTEQIRLAREIMKPETLNSRTISYEEIEYLKVHKRYLESSPHASNYYQRYRACNLIRSANCKMDIMEELLEPKEIQEKRLRQKKNQ